MREDNQKIPRYEVGKPILSKGLENSGDFCVNLCKPGEAIKVSYEIKEAPYAPRGNTFFRVHWRIEEHPSFHGEFSYAGGESKLIKEISRKACLVHYATMKHPDNYVSGKPRRRKGRISTPTLPAPKIDLSLVRYGY